MKKRVEVAADLDSVKRASRVRACARLVLQELTDAELRRKGFSLHEIEAAKAALRSWGRAVG